MIRLVLRRDGMVKIVLESGIYVIIVGMQKWDIHKFMAPMQIHTVGIKENSILEKEQVHVCGDKQWENDQR